LLIIHEYNLLNKKASIKEAFKKIGLFKITVNDYL
tara:strand:+ start:3211 stop:3315 length:105 start_codon:yes stop_codon:yes gene_type:complete